MIRTDELVRRVRAGEKTAAIAASLGVQPKAVRLRVSEARRKGKLPARERGPTLRERILPLALEGKESAAIADALGLPVNSVHRTISELRASGALPPVEPSRVPEDVLPLVRQGLNGAQIARRLGVSRDVVYKAVRALRNTGQLAPRNKAAVGTGRVPEPPSLASLPPRNQPLLFARFASIDEREARTDGLIDLLDLTERTCRWPVGDPGKPGFGFCGAEVSPGCKPYCATHGLRAYAPSAERKAIDRLLNIPKAKRVAA